MKTKVNMAEAKKVAKKHNLVIARVREHAVVLAKSIGGLGVLKVTSAGRVKKINVK